MIVLAIIELFCIVCPCLFACRSMIEEDPDDKSYADRVILFVDVDGRLVDMLVPLATPADRLELRSCLSTLFK